VVVLFLSLLGVFILATHGDMSTLEVSSVALFWGMLSAIPLVIYTVQPAEILKKYGTAVVIAWGMFIGGIALSITAKPWEQPVKVDIVVIVFLLLIVLLGSIFAFLFLCSFDGIKENVPFETKTNFFVGSFIAALTMLSGYFSIFLIGFLGFIIVLLAYFKKQYNTAIYYIGMFISSLVFAKLLYFGFGEGILGYRGQEALSNIQTGLFVNFSQTMKHLLVIFHKNNFFLFLILGCFIAALFVSIIKNIAAKKLSNTLLLTFAAVFSYIITLFFAPVDMKLLRYVAPLLPLCSVLFIVDTKRKYKTAVLFAVCCLSVLSILPISMNFDSFEHLDDSNIDSILSVKNPDIPVIIKGDTVWQLASFIPYIPDDQTCYMVGQFSDILSMDSNLFWYCTQEGSIANHYKDCCTLIQKNDITGSNYLIEYLFQKTAICMLLEAICY